MVEGDRFPNDASELLAEVAGKPKRKKTLVPVNPNISIEQNVKLAEWDLWLNDIIPRLEFEKKYPTWQERGLAHDKMRIEKLNELNERTRPK